MNPLKEKNMALDVNGILNALRSGTPPKKHIVSILSGRTDEIKNFKAVLDTTSTGTGMVKFMVGDYGAGKSFLLETFKHIALNDDFVVSEMQLNSGFRFNKIEEFYYAIMHNLALKALPQVTASFDDLFNLWIENLKHVPDNTLKSKEILWVCDALAKFNTNYSRAFLSYIRAKIKGDFETIRASSAWLSGEKHIPYAMKQKIDLIGSMDRQNAIDFLKAFVKLITLMDYKGLVILIDEADLILTERSDIRSTALSNLKYLVDLTTTGDLPNTLIVFSGANDLIDNPNFGVLSQPALFQRIQHHIWTISPLSREHLLELTEKTLEIFQKKYVLPSGITPEHVYTKINPSPQVQTREYVTALMTLLDQETN